MLAFFIAPICGFIIDYKANRGLYKFCFFFSMKIYFFIFEKVILKEC